MAGGIRRANVEAREQFFFRAAIRHLADLL